MLNSYSSKRSKILFEAAQKHIPGGVNSPVRAFKSVGGTPIFMEKAKDAYLYDVDGNSYIDFINSWGPMILGHANERVVEAVKIAAEKSFSFGTVTEAEIEIAALVKSMCANIDLVRFVSSGTEACMSALRLARGFTGKNKFIKFEGCYHGHADSFLVKAGSGLATLNIQTVPGVTKGVSEDTLTASYNNLEEVEILFEQNKNEIAAIFVEPVGGNMGCILPESGFLEGLRKLCDQHNAVLVFDEVMTGFRLTKGGVQNLYNINADLITYGKVIGGGMPIGAFGGKAEIMNCIAPVGSVYQAGTLSGNPVAVAAGITTLQILNEDKNIYDNIENSTKKLKSGISAILSKKGIAHTINQIGSMMSLHFTENKVNNFATASNSDIGMFNKFFHHCLQNGIYLPPSGYESWFISNSISDKEIGKVLEVVENFEV